MDKVAKFEEETGLKAVNREEFDEFHKWRQEQTKGFCESEDETSWKPEISADDAIPIEDEADLETQESDDLSGQSTKEGTTNTTKEDNEQSNDNNDLISPRNSKAIGDWGEKITHNYLKEKYPSDEVIWLNKNGTIGKGYDFVIRNNGEDIAYYEVKSKTDESPQLFQVSGTQWNWAKELYNSEKGNRYKIIVISNAGKKQPGITVIDNPIERWESGKLYADPVKIEL